LRHNPHWLLACMATLALVACEAPPDEPLLTCEDECASSDRVCAPEGGARDCTGPNSGGCLFWGPVTACADGESCVDGACVCDEPCEAGASLCADEGAELRCEVLDAGGCTRWSAPVACEGDTICEGGSCGCQSACEVGAAICDAEGVLLTCVQGAEEGACPGWGEPQTCGKHQRCSAGECRCLEPCQPGASVCAGEVGKVSCAGPDDEGCHHWGPLALCEEGMVCTEELNRCVTATPVDCSVTNECAYAGEILCMSEESYRQCKYGDDGCLKWDCST
jgi:hypothetical protein